MNTRLNQEDITQYASDVGAVKEQPIGDDYTLGAQIGKTIPAKWWNWLFSAVTKRLSQVYNDMLALYNELVGVLTGSNIQPSGAEGQLSQAIDVRAQGAIQKYLAKKGKIGIEWSSKPTFFSPAINTSIFYDTLHLSAMPIIGDAEQITHIVKNNIGFNKDNTKAFKGTAFNIWEEIPHPTDVSVSSTIQLPAQPKNGSTLLYVPAVVDASGDTLQGGFYSFDYGEHWYGGTVSGSRYSAFTMMACTSNSFTSHSTGIIAGFSANRVGNGIDISIYYTNINHVTSSEAPIWHKANVEALRNLPYSLNKVFMIQDTLILNVRHNSKASSALRAPTLWFSTDGATWAPYDNVKSTIENIDTDTGLKQLGSDVAIAYGYNYHDSGIAAGAELPIYYGTKAGWTNLDIDVSSVTGKSNSDIIGSRVVATVKSDSKYYIVLGLNYTDTLPNGGSLEQTVVIALNSIDDYEIYKNYNLIGYVTTPLFNANTYEVRPNSWATRETGSYFYTTVIDNNVFFTRDFKQWAPLSLDLTNAASQSVVQNITALPLDANTGICITNKGLHILKPKDIQADLLCRFGSNIMYKHGENYYYTSTTSNNRLYNGIFTIGNSSKYTSLVPLAEDDNYLYCVMDYYYTGHRSDDELIILNKSTFGLEEVINVTALYNIGSTYGLPLQNYLVHKFNNEIVFVGPSCVFSINSQKEITIRMRVDTSSSSTTKYKNPIYNSAIVENKLILCLKDNDTLVYTSDLEEWKDIPVPQPALMPCGSMFMVQNKLCIAMTKNVNPRENYLYTLENIGNGNTWTQFRKVSNINRLPAVIEYINGVFIGAGMYSYDGTAWYPSTYSVNPGFYSDYVDSAYKCKFKYFQNTYLLYICNLRSALYASTDAKTWDISSRRGIINNDSLFTEGDKLIMYSYDNSAPDMYTYNESVPQGINVVANHKLYLR